MSCNFQGYIYQRCELVKKFVEASMKFLREADIFLLVMCLMSSVYGIILISSATRARAGNFIVVQIGAVVIGIVLFILFSYLDIDIIADKSRLLFIFSILFVLTLIPWGVEIGGRNAWLRFGGIGIQPGEIIKVPLIIILGKMITNYKERKTLNSFLSLIQILFVFGMIFGVVIRVSEDIGTGLVYLGIMVVMLFIGGVKLRWFLLGSAIIAASFPFILNFFTPRHRARILAPFFPDMVESALLAEVLHQPNLSRQMISSGGFMGHGLGNGPVTQRGAFFALESDFIFAAAGEELGFVGLIGIILLLTIIIARCIYVGTKSNNPLGMLICTGISAMLIVQTLENIGMALGLLPVIGIPLPFFSYGGSSIVTYFAAAGIVSGIKMRPKPLRFRNL